MATRAFASCGAVVAAMLAAAPVAAQDPHWAFVPPVRPAVPAVEGTWARNAIDHFVQEVRERRGLAANPEASRGELLRRVTLDLTGLPPTLAELEAFVADERPDAYERVVDRLLASPAGAEESTRWWLDLARYADTHGMQRDQVRALWRWRDWVLDAYAANLPYDRFVTEQLAGDLLPAATDAQRIASGFLRNNPTSDEGGLIPEEYLARYAMNRTDTFGTACLGLTVGCAQCHDHKSDPLTQRDYYRLLAFFASFAEDGNDGGALAPAPAIAAPRPGERAELERRRVAAAAAEAAYDHVPWRALPSVPQPGGLPLTALPDGSLLATGTAPAQGDYVVRIDQDLAGLRALRLTAMADEHLPARGPGRAENGNFVLSELVIERGSSDGERGERVAVTAVDADFVQPGFAASGVIDDDPATGWALQGRHEDTALHVVFAAPLPAGTTWLSLTLRHRTMHLQHLLGRFAVHGSNEDLAALAGARRTARQARDDFERALPQCMVSGERDVPRPVHVLTRGRYDQPADEVPRGTPAFLPPMPAGAPNDRRGLAAWMFAPSHPLTARVEVNRIWLRHFGRGLVATPHDLGHLGQAPSHPALLDWLACELVASAWDEWHLHRLLVTSATYRQSARSDAAARERDPDNVWLTRTSRVRLAAEAIRDQALAVSGLLVQDRIGGPSVRIPQPPGIWEAVAFPGSNTEHYQADTGDDLHRRSLYTFWKRTAPPPLLTTFDAPSRETCVVDRQVTNTPLQTLAVWNDDGMVEATRAFAAACRAQGPNDAARLEFAFARLLQRRPTPDEARTATALLAQVAADAADGDTAEAAAWFALAGALLSLDEAMYRN